MTARLFGRWLVILGAMMSAAGSEPAARGQRTAAIFQDDFEAGLARWHTSGMAGVTIRDTGDPTRQHVLELVPNGDVFALIKGSERFGKVRLEGEVRFADETDNYLGVIYHHHTEGPRSDFGVIYIKGNDSYLQVNPHRDWNVSRTLYPEYRAPLRGPSAIRAGEWQRFAVEVIGRTAHFYVGDTETPQLTFAEYERSSGALGLQPRSVGGDVWVDNVRVVPIERFSYLGPPIPDVRANTRGMLSRWSVSGPYPSTRDAIAREPHLASWRPFDPDSRGAVVTGRVVDYHGPNAVAYFRTTVERQPAGEAELVLSTVDDLALWVNGRFHWFIPRADTAWFDFLTNPARKPQRIPIDLKAGSNELVFRVRGGVYASGGFFAAVAEPAR